MSGSAERPRPGPGALNIQKESNSLTVNTKMMETGLRANRAGIPYTLLLRIDVIGFPTFGQGLVSV